MKEDRLQFAGKKAVVENGITITAAIPLIPAIRSMKTRIMANISLSDDEKTDMLDKEKQVCAVIRLHVE